MLDRFSKAERVLLYAFMADFVMAGPIISLGFLSGSSSAASEGARAILLWSIDIFSLCMLLAVNRRKFSQFEFGIEKVQIAVQIVIAFGMCVSIVFIASKIVRELSAGTTFPNYIICVIFAVFSYINIMVNLTALRRMIVEERAKPSLILRGQIKNRAIMMISSVVATISAAAVVIPDPHIFAYIDAAGAVVVLCVIAYTMVQMMRTSIMTLLDAPIEEREKLLVFREIAERFNEWASIAFVRTRRLGYSKYIEIGLTFSDDTEMSTALATCRAIEEGIRQSLDNAFVAAFPVGEELPAPAAMAAPS